MFVTADDVTLVKSPLKTLNDGAGPVDEIDAPNFNPAFVLAP
jgi:hypothetical protein